MVVSTMGWPSCCLDDGEGGTDERGVVDESSDLLPPFEEDSDEDLVCFLFLKIEVMPISTSGCRVEKERELEEER